MDAEGYESSMRLEEIRRGCGFCEDSISCPGDASNMGCRTCGRVPLLCKEICEIGERIAGWKRDFQIYVLDYRAEFKRWDVERPGYDDMVRGQRIIGGLGFEVYVCQRTYGNIGPGIVRRM